MPAPARLRLLGCVVLAVAVAGVAAARVAPLGPRLDIELRPRFARDTFDVYHLDLSVVGGETIARVAVVPLRGSVRVHPPAETTDLGPGARFRVVVSVSHGVETTISPAVRVLQHGRVERSYDIDLGGAGPVKALDRLLVVATLYFGAFWTWAGVAKALAPDAAYDFAARVVGGGGPAKAVVVASVLGEVLLGSLLLSGAFLAGPLRSGRAAKGAPRRRAGLVASLALLAAFTALLVVARASGGGALACGCYAFFATSAASVDRELWINGVHAAILAALLIASTVLRPRAAD